MSLFIVIEGLDGSGKSSAVKRLTEMLNERWPGEVLATFEPNDGCCGGLFIRDVLKKNIPVFHPRQLALSYAANRLDHCSRVVEPWLAGGGRRMVVCDRFYLSSLVYQSFDEFGMEEVFALNQFARRPDLTFFLDVPDEVVHQRLASRNQPRELFEEKLAQTRVKYRAAIKFLIKKTGEPVVDIDGGGTVEEVATAILREIEKRFPDWRPIP